MRLIDANALLEHIKDLPTWWADGGGIYGQAMKYPEGMFDVDDVVASIENAPTLTSPNEWISVDERLPDEELNQIKRLFPGENEVEVLVMIEGAYIATTLYWDGEKFYDETSTYEVTHWMPLPAPTKKEHDHE